MSIDYLQIAQDQCFAMLAAADVGAGVHQHIKQDTPAPWVKIGEIQSENQSGKTSDGQEERLTLDVVSAFRGTARGPLLTLMNSVRSALDGMIIENGEARLSIEWVSAAASDQGADGVTYIGVSSFEILAEPA